MSTVKKRKKSTGHTKNNASLDMKPQIDDSMFYNTNQKENIATFNMTENQQYRT
jgi:hypothetical protein